MPFYLPDLLTNRITIPTSKINPLQASRPKAVYNAGTDHSKTLTIMGWPSAVAMFPAQMIVQTKPTTRPTVPNENQVVGFIDCRSHLNSCDGFADLETAGKDRFG